MNLNSGRERTASPINTGRPRTIIFACILLVLFLADRPATHATSLTDLARALASDNAAAVQVPSVSRKFSSLGLRREAASYLERSIHLAEISREKAAPLFEEIVRELSR
jgi:hypothetical protein